LQIEFCAKIKDAFESTGETATANESGDVFEGVMALEFVANIWGEKIIPLGIAACSHPKEEADFGRQAESFEKLGENEGDALVVMRYREALENMVNGVADADGKKGEAFDKKMSLKAWISCEKFIPAVSTENGFDSTGCEASEKPAGN
jgi:hypothetical protein